jgi:hypothetical protein
MFAATERASRTRASCGNEEDHRLAALRSLVQPALPALAHRDPALRVEVEERFAPARLGEPIDQPIASKLSRLEWLTKIFDNARPRWGIWHEGRRSR